MKEDLSNSIENIELIEDEVQRQDEINRVLSIIESYKMDKYQEYYLKGCLWNLSPFNSKERSNNVEKFLLLSIELNPKYIYSKTELSYFYFDENRYDDVVKLLDNLDLSIFETKDQLWKSLKLQELLISSKIHIANNITNSVINEYNGLVASYLAVPIDLTAVPRELVNAVIENANKEGMLPIIKNTLALINSKKHKVYFNDKIRQRLC